ncbi:MAG: hypothetical protein J7499_07055 [Sphingopyxis sp.]|nr:hypothetical protein [Sphingopyxis sp.]
MKRAVLAIFGDDAASPRTAAVAAGFGLRDIAHTPGLRLFVGDALPVQRLGNGTIMVGDHFPGTEAGNGCGWGNYLAFREEGREAVVARAPLTGLPLYWTQQGARLICSTHLPPFSAFAGPAGLDWDFVAHALSFVNLRTERSGLRERFELLAGSELRFDGRAVSVRSFWSPWDHVDRARPQSAADLAPMLRDRIVSCTAAWGGRRRDILLELSGGLDSSIVAAALAAAKLDYRALTLATSGADGDEREFARAVAQRCGVELIEKIHGDGDVDLVSPLPSPGFRPGAYSVLGGIDRAFEEVLPGQDISIFGGIGGDNIFAFDGSVAPIIDAFEHFGPGRRAFGVLRDRARASGATVWEAARLAWRARRRGPRCGWRRDVQFLNDTHLPAHPFAHPWDDGAARVSQAKRNHVESLRRILDFLDRPARWQGRDAVAPLLSQPIVEFCLSVPSWTWFEGGRDRMVARKAFAAQLPPEIVWRRGKGRLESLCAAAYLRQRHALGELLLEGRLTAHGLLDRAAIETYLGRDLIDGNFDYFRLIEIADVERWVRAVEDASP